jgi:hypothetical protein
MRGGIATGLALILGSVGTAVAQPDAPAATTPAPEQPAQPAEEAPSDLGFGFGSYGRIGVGTDLRGSTPEAVNVVKTGSRIVEASYTELDLYYRLRSERGVEVTTVTTLAAAGDPFHYTGEFDAALALRNFYAEAARGPMTLWIGSVFCH